MTPRERTAVMLNQGFIFWLGAMLPWSSWVGSYWGISIMYGWIVAGYIWLIGAGIHYELNEET